MTIKNNPQRCEACGSCSEARREGVISPNAETDIPERMCSLTVIRSDAIDPENAERLWTVSEEMVGQRFPL